MDDTPTPRIRILAGGEPSAEEVAALVVALTPAGGGEVEPGPGIPAWRVAAIHEGVGGGPFLGAPDLRPVSASHTDARTRS